MTKIWTSLPHTLQVQLKWLNDLHTGFEKHIRKQQTTTSHLISMVNCHKTENQQNATCVSDTTRHHHQSPNTQTKRIQSNHRSGTCSDHNHHLILTTVTALARFNESKTHTFWDVRTLKRTRKRQAGEEWMEVALCREGVLCARKVLSVPRTCSLCHESALCVMKVLFVSGKCSLCWESALCAKKVLFVLGKCSLCQESALYAGKVLFVPGRCSLWQESVLCRSTWIFHINRIGTRLRWIRPSSLIGNITGYKVSLPFTPTHPSFSALAPSNWAVESRYNSAMVKHATQRCGEKQAHQATPHRSTSPLIKHVTQICSEK